MGKIFRKCSIDGCDRRHEARGLCWFHHRRLRVHGDPLAGVAHGDPQAFLDKAMAYRGPDCLIWPYSKKAYGGWAEIRRDGKLRSVLRIICEAAHGAPPTPNHVARNTCGSKSCCNPVHVTWTKLPGGVASRKLNDEQTAEVISLRGVIFRREIAARFGVCKATIDKILLKRAAR